MAELRPELRRIASRLRACPLEKDGREDGPKDFLNIFLLLLLYTVDMISRTKKRRNEMAKMKHHYKEWRGGSLVNDLKRRYLLTQMIEVGRERRTLELKMAGYPMSDEPEQWKTSIDPRCGSKYSFILCGAPWSRRQRRIFAVEHETGAIFAVYEGSHSSRVNRERRFGTLDTLEDWNWAYTEPKLRLK